MKCQKCARPAVVHLTEILTHSDVNGVVKRALEIHLCLPHAVEAGLLTNGQPAAPAGGESQPATTTSIVPSKRKPSGLAAPSAVPADPLTCPDCGMSWTEFKKGGVMGCTHDYEQFSSVLMPLLKRAHEGATEHTGKVPARRRVEDVEKRRALARLRRELEKAVHLENYESAAQLRDQLKELDKV